MSQERREWMGLVADLREQLASAQARNECPECGLTPGPTAQRWCAECVGETTQRLAAAERERDTLETELRRVRNGVDFWAYCMSEGMRATCPEKVEELMDFLISLKIAPYYVRNKACEFVQSDRKAGGVE